MTTSHIQFQPGISIPEFLASFGTEARFDEAVRQVRWPQGYRRPRYDSAGNAQSVTVNASCSSATAAGTRFR